MVDRMNKFRGVKIPFFYFIRMKQIKSQTLLANSLIFVMMGMVLYFSYEILMPIISSSMNNQSDIIKIFMMIIIPVLLLCFIIALFKMFRIGESTQ